MASNPCSNKRLSIGCTDDRRRGDVQNLVTFALLLFIAPNYSLHPRWCYHPGEYVKSWKVKLMCLLSTFYAQVITKAIIQQKNLQSIITQVQLHILLATINFKGGRRTLMFSFLTGENKKKYIYVFLKGCKGQTKISVIYPQTKSFIFALSATFFLLTCELSTFKAFCQLSSLFLLCWQVHLHDCKQ